AITRTWKAGDTIDLVLPMKVQIVKSDEKVAADRGRVALRYGPLIYNVERADQPNINLALGSATLMPEWRGDLLDGVMTIKGQWADGSPLLAVPNYARNNRNSERIGSMVWIKNPPTNTMVSATTPGAQAF
ncbi:MAG TPA: Tat pathway signal protein, partial [Verrucomicrobiae bacterium]